MASTDDAKQRLDVQPVSFGPPDSLIPGWVVGLHQSPGLLLIQEWWGVTPIVKQQAALFASRGFRVLIPDLYKGTIGVDREEAGHLLTSLDYHLAVKEIGEAARYLLSAGSPAVGITGGCMGGALAFAAAQHVPELAAAAPWYGTPAREMPWIDVEAISIPVEYHVGTLDAIRGFSDPESGRAVIGRMQRAGRDATLFLYEGAPHSFMNALTPEGIEFLIKWDYGVPPPSQVQLCFDRVCAFFGKHLRRGVT